MKTLEKISDFISDNMAWIVLIVAGCALFFPSIGTWVKSSWITPLLMVVMFGMGLTMTLDDFKLVLSQPKDVIIGVIAQYTIMPLLGFLLSKLFNLDAGLTIGVVLVGTCPGGTSSNVITYLSNGDAGLSITMTSVSTLLAPILTPAITYLLLRSTVEVKFMEMFLSIIQVVILPIVAGVVINYFFRDFAKSIERILPLISVSAILLIAASVVSHNSAQIKSVGLTLVIVVILHNTSGYLLGYGVSSLMKMDEAKRRAVAIEVGMQNSGLASSLANQSFAAHPMAAVPGAVFSVVHNVSGALLAGYFRRKDLKEENNK